MSSSPPNTAVTVMEDQPRPNTPDSGGGGYFTLSESETGSNHDWDLKYIKDFNQSPKKYTFGRKIFSGLRSRSKTPPRPSPPKHYQKENTPPRPRTPERKSLTDEPLPPKPPPPLSYTSTLPPPVPKKSQTKIFGCRSKTLPIRKASKDKTSSRDQIQQSPANMEIMKQTCSVESVLPQSSSDECLHLSSPPQSSDEECLQSIVIPHPVTNGMMENLESEKQKQTITEPQTITKINPNMSLTLMYDLKHDKADSLKSKDNRKSALNTSECGQESIFLTSFRKAIKLMPENALCVIGQLDDSESVNKKINGTTSAIVNETLSEYQNEAKIVRQNRNEIINNSKSEESTKFHVNDNKMDEFSKKMDNLSNKVGQENFMSGTSKKLMNIQQKSNKKTSSQTSIAPKSLAERAKHSSQEQLKKLRSNVSMEEINKFKQLGMQALDLKCESPNIRRKSDTSDTISRSSRSSSKSSKSALKKEEIKQLKKEMNTKKYKGKAYPSKLFHVNQISNLIKRKETKTNNANDIGIHDNQYPIVLQDISNEPSVCGNSPTPSLESSISFTLTETSSLNPSTLEAVSEITSERSVDCWLSSPVQNSNMTDLDKYVSDMIASTQDIETPRTSPDINSNELLEILKVQRRQSTCEETKLSITLIMDQIGRLSPQYNNSRSLKTYSMVLYAGSYCCTPPTEEEIVTDWCQQEQNGGNRSFAQIYVQKEDILEDPKNIKVNSEIIITFRKENNDKKTGNEFKNVKVGKSHKGPTKEITLGFKDKEIEDYRPTPSPRLKRKLNKINSKIDLGTNFNVSEMGENTNAKFSDTSITSFNDLITDLFLSNDDLESKPSGSNNKENTATSSIIKKQAISADKLDKIKLIEEKEEIKCSQETLLVVLTDKIETEIKEKDKHRNQAEQFKSEIMVLNSKLQDHKKEKDSWKEKETDLCNKQSYLEQILKENAEEIESSIKKIGTQQVIIEDKEKRLVELKEGSVAAEASKHELEEFNKKAKKDLQKEIFELKELKTELINLININQDSNGQELVEQEKSLKQQLILKKREIISLKTEIFTFETEKQTELKQKCLLAKQHESEIVNSEQSRGILEEKIKQLQDQLTNECKEKLFLLEERRCYDTHISKFEVSQNKDEFITKLKIDLKKRGILLKDAQSTIKTLQKENNNKSTIKQLKNKIEDLECEGTTMIRARKNIEFELEEAKEFGVNLGKTNNILEEKYRLAIKENSSLSSEILENEEELKEIMKKYKNSVSSLSFDQITLQDQATTIIRHDKENETLKEELAILLYKIGQLETSKETFSSKGLQLKVIELEHKVELEKTTRNRMETQIGRLRETVEKIDREAEELRLKSKADQEKQRKLLNQLRDLKEDYITLQGKEVHESEQKNVLEKKFVIAESENIIIKKELEIALRRIDDFQIAINSEINSDTETINCSDDFDEN